MYSYNTYDRGTEKEAESNKISCKMKTFHKLDNYCKCLFIIFYRIYAFIWLLKKIYKAFTKYGLVNLKLKIYDYKNLKQNLRQIALTPLQVSC